jgi:hypothetical protein
MATVHAKECAACKVGLVHGGGHERYTTLVNKPELSFLDIEKVQAQRICDQLATMTEETWQNLLAHPVGVLALLASK